MNMEDSRNTYVKSRYGSSCMSYLYGHEKATGKSLGGRGGQQHIAKRQYFDLRLTIHVYSQQVPARTVACFRPLEAEEGTRVLTMM